MCKSKLFMIMMSKQLQEKTHMSQAQNIHCIIAWNLTTYTFHHISSSWVGIMFTWGDFQYASNTFTRTRSTGAYILTMSASSQHVLRPHSVQCPGELCFHSSVGKPWQEFSLGMCPHTRFNVQQNSSAECIKQSQTCPEAWVAERHLKPWEVSFPWSLGTFLAYSFYMFL